MNFKNTDPSNWLSLYEEWKQSRITQRDFCQAKGIAYQDFVYQREKYLISQRKFELTQDFPAAGFIKLERDPVQIPAPELKKQESSFIELVLPHGIILRIPAHASA